MKKNWFTILLLLYIGLSLTDAFLFGSSAYIEQTSWNAYLRAHLVLKIFIAAITGFLLFAGYKFAMPEKYEKRKDKLSFKIVAPISLLLVTFIMNTLIVLPLNEIERSADKKIAIKGRVLNKYYSTSSKGGRDWFLEIIDSRHGYYKLLVKRAIYGQYDRDSSFDKTMTEGMLGIIYRKEE